MNVLACVNRDAFAGRSVVAHHKIFTIHVLRPAGIGARIVIPVVARGQVLTDCKEGKG
jgi:hypothetical protein